jgi:hypothetical protein
MAASARARALSVPAGVSMFDLMGNETHAHTLSAGEPVYVLATGVKTALLEELLR